MYKEGGGMLTTDKDLNPAHCRIGAVQFHQDIQV